MTMAVSPSFPKRTAVRDPSPPLPTTNPTTTSPICRAAAAAIAPRSPAPAVGIAALDVLKRIPDGVSCGVGLTLRKQMPLGSGLGSSAASAAAAAEATNALFGHPLSRKELVLAGLASETAVSGYHADNIAPAVLGGFVLIRGLDPEIEYYQLKFNGTLHLVLVNPKFEAPTRKMRAAMPKEVPVSSWVSPRVDSSRVRVQPSRPEWK